MPPVAKGTGLASRIGPQCLHFFKALGFETEFLEEPVADWPEIPAYQKLASFARNVPVVNNATESIIKRTLDYANYGAKGEEDLQVTLQCVETAIAMVLNKN